MGPRQGPGGVCPGGWEAGCPVSPPGNPGGQEEPPASWRGLPLPFGRRGATCPASMRSLSPQGSCLRERAPRGRGSGLRTRTLSEGRRLCCLRAIAAGQQPPAQSPELPRATTPRWERTPQTGRSLAPAPRGRRPLLLPFTSGNAYGKSFPSGECRPSSALPAPRTSRQPAHSRLPGLILEKCPARG